MSCDSPAIKQVYAEFFEKPGSHLAHELLHTSYADEFDKL
ncbi:MAG: iron hydrogenase small subunit [Solobacterium sp.]|nr:iron hydrogenase small subunit [Solobacterium sp.]